MPSRFQRKGSKRPLKPRRVIFVEGQTEKQYFNGLKQRITTVTIDPRFEKNPKDMVKEAKKVIRGEWNKDKDELWFVLDNEETNKRQTPEYWQALTHFSETNPKISTNICISNVCFETWLLAHFQNHGLNQNAHQLERALSSALNDTYQKGGKLKVDTFLDRTTTALQNANTSPLSTCPPPLGHTHIPHMLKSQIPPI